MVTLRVRSVVWFATGIALTLLAGLLVFSQWRVDAAPGDTDSTFVPVAPCRLFDTRPGEKPDGPKKSPLGAGDNLVMQQKVTGSVGDCVGIPGDAAAVSLNVTIVGPTSQSNLRVFPADVPTPDASNLNWLAGQSPTPNKVDVKLSATGEIKFYNQFGTVHVLADVVGYYTPKSLKDLAAQAGTPGPQGPVGPQGPAGWETIPSGVTVTGSFSWDGGIISDNEDHKRTVTFPGRAPASLAIEMVNFNSDGIDVTTDDDLSCTGSIGSPTAPPGRVCLYHSGSSGIYNLNGESLAVGSENGFVVRWNSDGLLGDDMWVFLTWAYTAP